MSKIAIVSFAVLLSLMAGCAPKETTIEQQIERELTNLVGPAEDYNVELEGVRDSDYVRRVYAVGRRVQPDGSPILDRVDVELRDVRYDPDRRRIESIDSAVAVVRLLPEDIAVYLEDFRDLRDVSVTLLSRNRVEIETRPNIRDLSTRTTVTITGTLVPTDGGIDYDITEVRADGVTLPRSAERLLSDEINPIVDLEGMDIVFEVTGIQFERNTIIIRAEGEYDAPR